MDFTVKTDEGAYDLEAGVRLIGRDLLVAIWGGEKPHIGAVSAALPRPSLKDPKATSASASVICFLGHKEDELAKAASIVLSSRLNTSVVVTAGIHWDDLREEDIKRIMHNSEILVDLILDRLKTVLPSSH